ncbi:bicyclomycin/multidrug efflux system [Pseudovibrio axinellae]|uniref:Bicyclomycin/multidrug efflux system n=1 Tax=Pseudovibrio axinellae TaxID=989403 RepID=A0A165U1X9_9HYPH|nr:MFS transporter [Pseudovibrio axinellae]KZL09460.1 bicyclomycin/multidrug efflux system [Pseudovibrio axinellae]SEQ64193.1 Predicted arabinose efflux permease, MFS family [Pseudovibrio axinellae]
MLSVLANRTYRHLFFAQVISLFGTGLATVALSLLAFNIAGDEAGSVLGTAFAIKMVAYVGLAPIAAALIEKLPRRAVLVGLDLIRAAVALALPFVTEIWQIYLLIFLLQSASAAFTPSFQAVIPDVLPDEKDYTNALSLSRLAYDLENLLSPTIAAALLLVIDFQALFGGTVLGFIASAALVVSVTLPKLKTVKNQRTFKRTTQGTRIYLSTPRLRGMLCVYLAVAAGGAMVIVNTVVIVQGTFGLQADDVAVALACFGAGSMITALSMPKVLESFKDRSVMIWGASLMAICLSLGFMLNSYTQLLPLWFIMGLGYSAAQTPSGRVLRRSASGSDLPSVFASQFALSHVCWLIGYPLAGWVGSSFGIPASFMILALLAWISVFAALMLWPRKDAVKLRHSHQNLPDADPHWAKGVDKVGKSHVHDFKIDDLHTRWPSSL